MRRYNPSVKVRLQVVSIKYDPFGDLHSAVPAVIKLFM